MAFQYTKYYDHTSVIAPDSIRNGRFLKFQLDNIPPGEELMGTMMANAKEVIRELQEQGYIELPEDDEVPPPEHIEPPPR